METQFLLDLLRGPSSTSTSSAPSNFGFFLHLFRNCWACEQIKPRSRVPTWSVILRQFFPYMRTPSMKRSCSSWVHGSLVPLAAGPLIWGATGSVKSPYLFWAFSSLFLENYSFYFSGRSSYNFSRWFYSWSNFSLTHNRSFRLPSSIFTGLYFRSS